MKIAELLTEAAVKSSWIARVDYSPYPARILTLVLKNGNMYKIPNVTTAVYQQFLTRPSKGKYWHQFIKGRYLVNKVGKG
jgi:hypothetical protein